MSESLMSIIVSIAVFLVAFISIAIVNMKIEDKNKKSSITFYILFSLFSISSILGYFIISKEGMIYNLKVCELYSILVASIFIYFAGKIKKTKIVSLLVDLVSAGIIAYFIPKVYLEVSFSMNVLLTKAILTLIIFTLLQSFQFINKIDGIASLQFLGIGLGISILLFAGAIPVIFGFFSFLIIAIFLALFIFNKYPSKISIDNDFLKAFGFISLWLLSKSGIESSIMTSLIMLSFMMIETTYAIGKRLTFFDKYKKTTENTFHYTAKTYGKDEKEIGSAIFKIMVISAFLSSCQLFSPSEYSVLAFSFVVNTWFLLQITQNREDSKLKNINNNFVKEIKKSVDNIKNIINKK